MDTFQLRNTRIAKSNGIPKFRRLQVITNLFRLVEALLFLILISKLSTRLPLAATVSGQYLKELILLLACPRFVFILGNAIVIALFARSGHYTNRDSATKSSSFDLYQEFLEKSEKKKQGILEYRPKQSIHEEAKTVNSYRKTKSESLRTVNYENSCGQLKRSETEKCMKVRDPEKKMVYSSYPQGQLRRSETDKCTEICDSEKKMVKSLYPENCMSNEEFRDKIEAFIARQKRLQKDEECYVF